MEPMIRKFKSDSKQPLLLEKYLIKIEDLANIKELAEEYIIKKIPI